MWIKKNKNKSQKLYFLIQRCFSKNGSSLVVLHFRCAAITFVPKLKIVLNSSVLLYAAHHWRYHRYAGFWTRNKSTRFGSFRKAFYYFSVNLHWRAHHSDPFITWQRIVVVPSWQNIMSYVSSVSKTVHHFGEKDPSAFVILLGSTLFTVMTWPVEFIWHHIQALVHSGWRGETQIEISGKGLYHQ